MKKIFAFLMFFPTLTIMAQFPLVDEWLLNTTGELGDYEYHPGAPPNSVSVDMPDSVNVLQICYDNDYVYIRTNGLAAYTMGPWLMNPNTPSAIESIYRFPRNPIMAGTVHQNQPPVGALGCAINGVKLYGTGDAKSYNPTSGQNDAGGDGLWNSDAWVTEGATMDATGGGHPDGNGNYHYHASPIALYSNPSTTHSPIIGWAFDGFPIYGPFGYVDSLSSTTGVQRMESSYQLRNISDRTTLPGGIASVPVGPVINSTFPLGTYWEDYEYVAGSGTLDEYNGRWCVTPEYPAGIFAYFITMDVANEPQYPYLIGPKYYGVVNPSDIGGAAGNITIPLGVSCVNETNSIEQSEFTFEVYPNPVKEKLTLKGMDTSAYTVYDQLGRFIFTGTVENTIDVSMLEEGSYILKIEEKGRMSYSKFIKL
ncbi:MAG: YHYH protein [Crocinitomicaceae bacterium]|nr:YHYH protein [Crocinitomicaceae bacterium]